MLRGNDLSESAKRLQFEIENLAEDIKMVKGQREKELRKGGKFQALEEEVKEKSHELVRLTTVLDLKTTNIEEETKKRRDIESNVKELGNALQEKAQMYEGLKGAYDTAKSKFDTLNDESEKKEELLQTLLTGVASKEGHENGYQNQLQGEWGMPRCFKELLDLWNQMQRIG